MGADNEGEDFFAVLGARVAPEARQRVEQRMRRERRAGMTDAERGRRKGEPKLQLNVRASSETRTLFEDLCQHLGKSKTDVMEMAIAALAKATPGFKRGGK
jgi:hypothetical protein